MSLTFEPTDVPIAIIKNDDKKDKKIKKRDKVIYIDENSSSNNNYKELTLNNNDGKFQFIPDSNKERFIAYIVGASGSGKSWYASELGNEYKKLYPKNPIYLLSYVDNDSSIEKINGIQRIKLDEDFINTDLDSTDFENSLTIWDDTDCITDKKLVLKLRDLLGKLLNTGRHTGTSVIYLSHIACNGIQTKAILNESHSITFFNNSLGGKAKKYLLGNYFGLNNKQIDCLDDIEGRAITILKSYPMVLISEKKIMLIKYLGKSNYK
jgi:hypothetical protein